MTAKTRAECIADAAAAYAVMLTDPVMREQILAGRERNAQTTARPVGGQDEPRTTSSTVSRRSA